ncbi:hypothetical protein ACFX15_040812 [Malus domestica]
MCVRNKISGTIANFKFGPDKIGTRKVVLDEKLLRHEESDVSLALFANVRVTRAGKFPPRSATTRLENRHVTRQNKYRKYLEEGYKYLSQRSVLKNSGIDQLGSFKSSKSAKQVTKKRRTNSQKLQSSGGGKR